MLALSLAQSLLCTSSEKPCGSCDACQKVGRLIHPDLHFSFPLNNPKDSCQEHYPEWREALREKPFMSIGQWFGYLDGESKNANISVAEIRNFIHLLGLTPYESRHTVMILWLPEYLGQDGNRLLKLFEEPPQNVFIIMATENPDMLLPTIHSRAQRFRMRALSPEEAADRLVRDHACDRDLALSAVIAADGHFETARHQLLQAEIPAVDFLKKLLQSCFTYHVIQIVEWVDTFVAMNKEEQKQFLLWTQLLLSFVIRYRVGGRGTSDIGRNAMLQYAAKLSASLQYPQIEAWNDLLDETLMATQRNANARLLMTDFCIRLSHIVRETKLNN